MIHHMSMRVMQIDWAKLPDLEILQLSPSCHFITILLAALQFQMQWERPFIIALEFLFYNFVF